jgi:ElaB/YqjD/DUF883 family membrane-anchored ribosome-binding protein
VDNINDQGQEKNPAKKAAGGAQNKLEETKEQVDESLKKAGQEVSERATYLKRNGFSADHVREWVNDYPTVAVAAVSALGILVGSILATALAPKRPKTFSEKVELRARELARQAQRYAREAGGYAKEAGDDLSRRAHGAARVVEGRMVDASRMARERIEQAGDLSEMIGDAVRAAVVTVVSKKVNDWVRHLAR